VNKEVRVMNIMHCNSPQCPLSVYEVSLQRNDNQIKKNIQKKLKIFYYKEERRRKKGKK